jgi:hypothetical protein
LAKQVYVVLGQRARAFNTIFATAQQKLKATFGMELVELPSRSGLEQENTYDAQSQDAPVPTGIKKRGLFPHRLSINNK